MPWPLGHEPLNDADWRWFVVEVSRERLAPLLAHATASGAWPATSAQLDEALALGRGALGLVLQLERELVGHRGGFRRRHGRRRVASGLPVAKPARAGRHERAQLSAALDRLPKVAGAPGEIHISNDLNRLLNITDKLAQQRGDQYIASELFVLAAFEDKATLAKLFKDCRVHKASVEKAIDEVRGGESVKDANAEESREALRLRYVDGLPTKEIAERPTNV